MIKVITAPAAYPVSLAEARVWIKQSDPGYTSEDGLITMLIAAMTSYAENITGRAFVERTLELSLDYFDHCIELPWAPLIGIDSISYTDSNDAAATFSSASYEVDTVSQPGKVRPGSTFYWPSIGRGFNPVRIRYRAGYVAPGSPQDLTDNSYLPGQLRTWIHARLSTIYDNRNQMIVGGSMQAIPRDFADGLLDSLILGSRIF